MAKSAVLETPVAKVKVAKAAKAPRKSRVVPATAPEQGRLVWLAPEEYAHGVQTRIREAFDIDNTVRDLAISIYDHGQKVPANATESEDNGKPVLDSGFTRDKAVQLIRRGFETAKDIDGFTRTIHDSERKLLVMVTPPTSDYQRFIAGILENRQQRVTDVQEALAHKELRDRFGKSEIDISEVYGYTNDNRVRNLRNLLECDPRVIDEVHEGRLSVNAAIQTACLTEAKVALVVAQAKEGKVTARDVADMHEEPEAKAKSEAEDSVEDSPVASKVPRNASAIKKFITENILSPEDRDSFSEPTIKLAQALLVYIAGQKTDIALLNAWNGLS